MSTSFPSLMSRKKKVDGTRRFDTAKVIPDFSPGVSVYNSSYADNFHGKRNINHLPVAGKIRKDDTAKVTFLFENPRFINKPVCFANSNKTAECQSQWWPEKVPKKTNKMLIYKADTVSRSDFLNFGNRPDGLTRFGCNKNRMKTASGIVPSLSSAAEPLVAREKLSFEHQFNCRQERKERGKLHGSFVWEPVVDQRLIDRIKFRMKQQNSSVFA